MIEISAMKTLKHKNIQNISGFSFENSTILISMPIAKGTLSDFIYSNHNIDETTNLWRDIWINEVVSPYKVDFTLRYKYTKQLLKGIMFMHQYGIIHRDLKPQNILISQSNVLKITDFGLAYTICSGNYDGMPKDSNVVTLWYRDYNLVVNSNHIKVYSYDIDIWAAAIIIMELETGVVPTVAIDDEAKLKERYETVFSINKDNKGKASGFTYEEPKWLFNISNRNLQKMLMQMLQLNPMNRITAEQAISMI